MFEDVLTCATAADCVDGDLPLFCDQSPYSFKIAFEIEYTREKPSNHNGICFACPSPDGVVKSCKDYLTNLPYEFNQQTVDHCVSTCEEVDEPKILTCATAADCVDGDLALFCDQSPASFKMAFEIEYAKEEPSNHNGMCIACPSPDGVKSCTDILNLPYEFNQQTVDHCINTCMEDPVRDEEPSEPVDEWETVEFNCYDDNGGCSHDCDSVDKVCKCPPCWALDTDDATCKPEAGRVTTTCTHNTMEISVDKCLLDGTHDISRSYMGDPSCALVDGGESETHVTVSVGLEQCGTSMNFDDVSDTIIYTNNMFIPPQSKENIFLSAGIEWNFSCSYRTDYDVSKDAVVQANSLVDEFAGVGEFALELGFYEDDTFGETIENAEFQVGKPVLFGIKFNEGVALNNLIFVPTDCVVENKADVNDDPWKVWDYEDETMCDGGGLLKFQILETPYSTDSFLGMSYMGFGFESGASNEMQQRLKCSVKICPFDEIVSPCVTGCFA